MAHPSQPNYLALFSGSTQGVTDDSCPQSFGGPNLAAQLLAAGRTFAGYSEDLPGAGSTAARRGELRPQAQPVGRLPGAARVGEPALHGAARTTSPTLPTVSFVVPNLCHDMHDCSVATGDAWAEDHLAAYVRWAQTHNSLLVVTFDEDDGHRRPTTSRRSWWARWSRPAPSAQRIDHYGVLRTLEDMYGLAPIGSAAGAKPLTGIWTG